MNVLVVDDQYDVVQGVIGGVNWQALSVRNVYAAYSVEEACAILRDQNIHVLLCDIEIPPRSGFEVLEWIREHGLPTHCIFLTAHASFDYAQTALKLRSFDYLLQPARYEEIEAAVGRALSRFAETQRIEADVEYGRFWKQQEEMLVDSCVDHFLQNADPLGHEAFLANLQALGIPLRAGDVATPVLVHAVLAPQGTPVDAPSLRRRLVALLMERLPGAEQAFCAAGLHGGGLLLLLYGETVAWNELPMLFQEIFEACRAEGVALTFYIGAGGMLHALRQEHALLARRKQDNVAGYSGVFTPAQKRAANRYVYTFGGMRRWAEMLLDGRCDEVLAEATLTLQRHRDDGTMDAAYLARFHQDFTQMFFAAVRDLEQRTHSILYDAYPFEDFLDAYSSYEKMQALVAFAIGYIRARIATPHAAGSPVDAAAQYIQEHIDRNLTCAEIAEAVHLNASYLTRLFKRERGVALNVYIVSEKMRVAASLLRVTSIPVSLIAAKVGYSNFSYFSQVFRKYSGKSPLEYRQEARAGTEDGEAFSATAQ